MRGLLWLFVVLNVLVLLAGVSGTLGSLPLLSAAGTPETATDTADSSGGVRRLVLLGEGASGAAAREQSAVPAGSEVPVVPGPAPTSSGKPPADANTTPAPERPAADQGAPDRADADTGTPPLASGAPQVRNPGVSPDVTLAADDVAAVAPTCFEIGPFAMDGAAADVAARAVRDAGGQVLRRDVHGAGPIRHWVFIEGLADRVAVVREQERLQGAGYSDVLPIEGSSGWTISLGLFSQGTRARAHRDALRSAGFDAKFTQRRSGPERTWLRVALAHNQRTTLAEAMPAGTGLAPCPDAGN